MALQQMHPNKGKVLWKYILIAIGLIFTLNLLTKLHIFEGCKKGHRSSKTLAGSSKKTSSPIAKAYPTNYHGRLVEQGPDPDYPTPLASGTENLFYLEEPDRGPTFSSVTIPKDKVTRYQKFVHCSTHPLFVHCSHKVDSANLQRLFLVGYQNNRIFSVSSYNRISC